MTTTAWKQADGGKSVPWTNPTHLRVSSPCAAQSRLPVPEEIDSDQSFPDHGELSAGSSIYTLDIDDPWAKKSILCLDGGGVRNLSSLLILRELMGAVEEQERRINPEAKSSADSSLVNYSLDEQPTRTRSSPAIGMPLLKERR